MKRHIIRISLVILLGGVTSIAVAWGLAMWGPDAVTFAAPFDQTPSWARSVPDDWPSAPQTSRTASEIGVRCTDQLWWDRDQDTSYLLNIGQFGFPWLALEYEGRIPRVGATLTEEWRGMLGDAPAFLNPKELARLPIAPLAAGMAMNTLVYAGVWYPITLLPGMFIRWRRRRAGRCVKCGYDLRGAMVGDQSSVIGVVCPECGKQR